jgi:hypothetical protein
MAVSHHHPEGSDIAAKALSGNLVLLDSNGDSN